MARTQGSLRLPSNLEMRVGAPVDARMIVPTYADLTVEANFPYNYVGMLVAVQETGRVYVLKAKPTTATANWAEVGAATDLSDYYTKQEVDALVASVYKPKGSVAFASLPTLGASVLGNVYNVNEAFTTTSDFLDGAGKTYPANTNVVVVNIGTNESPTYKFDVLAGFVDLSTYQKIMQYSNLSTTGLTAADLGKVVQYVGTTTADYTSGFFYRVVEGETQGTYEWEAVNTQAQAPSALEHQLVATRAAGGVSIGDTFQIGTTFEELFNAILNPVLYPTFVAPTATLTATDVPSSNKKLIETGDTFETTFTLALNRGEIKLNGVFQDYRSGAATQYSFDGSQSDVSNTFTRTIDSNKTSYQGTINYAEGPQPVDSLGRDVPNSKLAAGSVTSNSINFEFVDAMYANTAAAGQIAKLALVSKVTNKVRTFDFPDTTAANPEVFDVPASWTLTAIEIESTFDSSGWQDATEEFSITQVSHDDAAGNPVSYNRYTCNKGYNMGARKVRIKWS